MRDKLLLSFQVARVFQKTGYFSVSEQIHADCMSMIGFRRDKTWKLSGLVVSGVRKASFFTQLDWVQEQCMEKLGFRPYPGTLNLNLEVLEEGQPTVQDLQEEEGIKLIPPDPNFCAATVLPVYLGGVKGAIVVPDEEVNVHGKQIIEVLAPLRLRDRLGVKDGDMVTLVIDKYSLVA